MPKSSTPQHILDLAKRGAEARFHELTQELKLLVDLFPHLRDAVDEDELPVSFIIQRDGSRSAPTRGRKRAARAERSHGTK
ncbi:MAG TPA: hypothetical protein VG871_12395 [Vicinamibacterales bacterium]|jgi:hypothetical protein|nr:hypothetical protein [Vicinamibacterales bacterium]HVZ21861.1 hypothetical protein [Vicinamibacterales bacterium]